MLPGIFLPLPEEHLSWQQLKDNREKPSSGRVNGRAVAEAEKNQAALRGEKEEGPGWRSLRGGGISLHGRPIYIDDGLPEVAAAAGCAPSPCVLLINRTST